MASNHHEAFVEAPVSLPSERSTGLVFAGVCAIAAVLLRGDTSLMAGLLVGSGVFAGLALLKPELLAPLNVAWFKFALLLNRVVSPVVMLALFLMVIVPFGLVMQLLRDPLQRARVPSRERTSYWIARDDSSNKSTMRDQF